MSPEINETKIRSSKDNCKTRKVAHVTAVGIAACFGDLVELGNTLERN